MLIDEYIKELPDIYAKDPESNNYKILRLFMAGTQAFRDDMMAVDETADITKAFGKTLDLFGEMVGRPRGKATDEQYRMLIMQQAAANRTEGDYNSVVSSLAAALGVDVKSFVLRDTENPAEVEINNLPYAELLNAGITGEQAAEIIRGVLPSGVSLAPVNLNGTFEFGGIDEYAETTGFGNVTQTIGGYFGYLAG